MTVQVVDDHFPEPAAGEAGPYALIVSLQAKPGSGDALNELLLSGVEGTRAEPGCLAYHLNRDRLDPDSFSFYESYTGLDAFRRHLEAPYIAALLEKLPPLLARDNSMTFFTVPSWSR
jgi:quinol monooxygenase YgiN